MSAIGDLGGDHLLDGKPAAGDQADDPGPVGDRVAPGAGQRDVVLGEHHRVDGRPALVCRPVWEIRPAERTAASAVCSARSLPEHSMTASTPMPSVCVLDPGGDVDARRGPRRRRRRGSVASAARVGFTSETMTRAPSGGVERGQRADRPGAGDEHGVAGPHAGRVHAVRRHGGRLDQRALQVGDLVRQDAHVAGRHDGELGDAAPAEAQPDAGHRDAQVVQPAPAVVARAAVEQRHDRHPLALPDRRHAGADLHDLGGELVAEDLRQLATR